MLNRPGSSGVEAPKKTRWTRSMAALRLCYRWRIQWTQALHPGCPASLRRKPRPPYINASSWAAAMSCQAALRLSARHCTHMQVPWEANITSLSGQKIKPTHPPQKQAPPFTEPARGSEIRKTLQHWYEPWECHLPSTLTALPMKLIKCNFNYIMGQCTFTRLTAIVNHFYCLWQLIKLCFAKQCSLTHSARLWPQGTDFQLSFNVVYCQVTRAVFSHTP